MTRKSENVEIHSADWDPDVIQEFRSHFDPEKIYYFWECPCSSIFVRSHYLKDTPEEARRETHE
jgi:hypothetical protein